MNNAQLELQACELLHWCEHQKLLRSYFTPFTPHLPSYLWSTCQSTSTALNSRWQKIHHHLSWAPKIDILNSVFTIYKNVVFSKQICSACKRLFFNNKTVKLVNFHCFFPYLFYIKTFLIFSNCEYQEKAFPKHKDENVKDLSTISRQNTVFKIKRFLHFVNINKW